MTLFDACRASNCNQAERRGEWKNESSCVIAQLCSYAVPISLESFRIIRGVTDQTVVRKISLKDFTRKDWQPVFVASHLVAGARA